MRHKSQSSQFMHPNLCQKGVSGLLQCQLKINQKVDFVLKKPENVDFLNR